MQWIRQNGHINSNSHFHENSFGELANYIKATQTQNSHVWIAISFLNKESWHQSAFIRMFATNHSWCCWSFYPMRDVQFMFPRIINASFFYTYCEWKHVLHIWILQSTTYPAETGIDLTHWGRDKMAAISQTTLSNAFSWLKMLEFRFKFQWSLFIRIKLTIFQHWFRWWLGADHVILAVILFVIVTQLRITH